MKGKSKELDVDFIGGQGPLTKKEEKALDGYLQTSKTKQSKRQSPVKVKRVMKKSIDFYVDPRRMTEEYEKAISDYIKADKLKQGKKTPRKKTVISQLSSTVRSKKKRFELDFNIKSRSFTKIDEKEISDHISAYKAKQSKNKVKSIHTKKTKITRK